MGLFDFFKKPKPTPFEVNQAKQLLKQLQESVNLINTTTVPKTFWGRLNLSLDILLELQKYERFGFFKGSTPTQDYNRILGNLEATVNDFIDRAIIAHVDKYKHLQSQDEKDKKFKNFIGNLWNSFYEANDYWQGNNNYPHYAGKLFVDSNLQRVDAIYQDAILKESQKKAEKKQLPPKSAAPKPPDKQQTIYFRNGNMYKILYGSKEDWYDARYLVSDNILYDLESTEDLQRIEVPDFSQQQRHMDDYGVTGSLDYVIRMKAARLRDKGMIPESNACYRKATDLMFASGNGYDIKPYLYLAKELLREGHFEESEAEEERIYKMLNTSRAVISCSSDIRPYITQEDREYYRLKYALPGKTPKSISGYSRMKNAKSANFLKLVDLAKEQGIEIKLSD